MEVQDGHLWGFLSPQNSELCRIDFQKLKPKYSIGRRLDGGNDIILPDTKISNFHCIIEWGTDETWSVVKVADLSSNGTFINGQKIGRGKTMHLYDGDVITFGTCRSQVTVEGLDDYRFVYRHVGATPSMRGLLSAYDLHDYIGQGGFATVVKALHKKERTWHAVKRIPVRSLWRGWGRPSFTGSLSDASYDFSREIVVMERLQHKNICQLREVFFDEFGLSIVLEWIAGGDLFDLLLKRKNGLPESETQYLTYQICDALAYVHRQGIAHRDLKPENILLTADQPPVVKVADFGLAKIYAGGTKLRTQCGTPIFSAPEVTKRKQGATGYDQLVDSWSVGVMVFSMLTTVMPFPENEDGSPVSHRQIHWPLLDEFHVSDGGQDFIRRLLKYEPSRRMSSSKACKHPWLANEHRMSTAIDGS